MSLFHWWSNPLRSHNWQLRVWRLTVNRAPYQVQIVWGYE